MNSRITPKERGLLKGAIRRVFSRSELRRKIIDTVRIEHYDPKRPRVKKWSLCPKCSQKTPSYLMVLDHVIPIIPVDTTLEQMDWDTVINRTWCEDNNLEPICKPCHNVKTGIERKQRAANKKKRELDK